MPDTKWVFVRDGAVWEVFEGSPAWAGETSAPLDLREVADAPDGLAPGWLVDDAGAYTAPPPPPVIAPPSPPPVLTYKADLWRRATDDEAGQMEAALQALPIRLRRMYEDSQHIDHGDEFFAPLSDGLIDLFGEARASEILAASA